MTKLLVHFIRKIEGSNARTSRALDNAVNYCKRYSKHFAEKIIAIGRLLIDESVAFDVVPNKKYLDFECYY